MSTKQITYGLIGEHLTHSYSCEIHAKLADYSYKLCELTPEEVGPFMTAKAFRAINVTIPYKKTVMPYLDVISDRAASVGAVNTVVNNPEDGKLYGYNTDFAGMAAQLCHMGLSLTGKKVLILGTGGTCATAVAVAREQAASAVYVLSRHPKAQGSVPQISYEEAYTHHADAQIIINTTPKGMYHREQGTPIDISAFPKLEGVMDAIYHPLRTQLVQDAQERGIPAAGGLYMLVSQAVYACAHFLHRPAPEAELTDRVYAAMCREKQNLVLIGMPSAGKTTVGKRLAAQTGMPFVDTDEQIVRRLGRSIAAYIAAEGEAAFRQIEAEVVTEVSETSGCILATGGGAVLRKENVRALRQNGCLIFLDRSPANLVTTSDRPLSSSREKLEALYATRYDIYKAAADLHVPADGSVEAVAEDVLQQVQRLQQL